jgi:hypothetical protein
MSRGAAHPTGGPAGRTSSRIASLPLASCAALLLRGNGRSDPRRQCLPLSDEVLGSQSWCPYWAILAFIRLSDDIGIDRVRLHDQRYFARTGPVLVILGEVLLDLCRLSPVVSDKLRTRISADATRPCANADSV